MRNFHPTQIAVNLLLIVVLAIQPVSICMAQGGFGAGCTDAANSTCSGCGCCDTSGVEDRFCCCRGSAKEEITEESCCSGHETPSGNDTLNAADEVSAQLVVSDTLVPNPICLCGHDLPPLSDSSPRYPNSENRDTLSTPSQSDGVVSGLHRLLVKSPYSTSVLPMHHYSQVVLCIWRL